MYARYESKLDKINAQLLEVLNSGNWKKWTKEWSSESDLTKPYNPLSKTLYRGGNTVICGVTKLGMNYQNNLWCTSKQLEVHNFYPTKASKGQWITLFFPNIRKFKNEDGTFTNKFLGVYPASLVNFNPDFVAEKEGCKKSVSEYIQEYQEVNQAKNHTPLEYIEARLEKYIGATGIIKAAGEPAYSPTLDTLYMPSLGAFHTPEAYYSTYLHECGHSTGHDKRLGRLKNTEYGSPEYAKEELVAELFSIYACAYLGMEYDLSNHASYLGSWARGIRDDAGYFLTASTQAYKALDYFLLKAGLESPKSYEAEVSEVIVAE